MTGPTRLPAEPLVVRAGAAALIGAALAAGSAFLMIAVLLALQVTPSGTAVLGPVAGVKDGDRGFLYLVGAVAAGVVLVLYVAAVPTLSRWFRLSMRATAELLLLELVLATAVVLWR